MAVTSPDSKSSTGVPVFGRGRGWWGTVAAWMRGAGALPTTAAGAELVIVLAFLGLRLVDLAQLAVAVPSGLGRSSRPVLDAALMTVYVLDSVVLGVIVIRARRYRDTRLAWVDITVALAILVAEPAFTHTADRVGTWTAWGYPISVGVAFGAGIGFPKRWQTTVAGAVLAVAYLAVSLPEAGGARSTVFSNAVGYIGFSLIVRALAGYLRRLGADADAGRTEAAQLAAQREFDRHKLLLHDQASVLRMISDPTVNPQLVTLLQEQAALGANRIRAFLGQRAGLDPATTPTRETGLVAAVLDTVAGFGDLPIDLSLTLATTAELSAAATTAVAEAVSAVLHNVRMYAGPTSVVIHADHNPATDAWELVVLDNGAGFDPAHTPFGFGLAHQVIRSLADHKITAVVESAPGQGTTITMCGLVEQITL